MSRTLQEIEAARAARKDALEAKRIEQYAIDLEALDAAETEHGDSNVARIDVPFTPGQPTMALARVPTSAELKRYQHRLKPKGDKPGDPIEAAHEIGESCLIYPDKESFQAMRDARPLLLTQLGSAAADLGTGTVHAAGKG